MAPTRGSTSSIRKRRRRSVYIIARPTSVAGGLSSLSQGKFPLCHWGLLLSPYNEIELRTQCLMLNIDENLETSWGTLFELRRTKDGTNEPQITKFGPMELLNAWNYACIAYVGKTKVSDYTASVRAHGITNIHPDYHWITNNCQNFVEFLLDFTCPRAVRPATIQETLNRHLKRIDHKHQPVFIKASTATPPITIFVSPCTANIKSFRHDFHARKGENAWKSTRLPIGELRGQSGGLAWFSFFFCFPDGCARFISVVGHV